MRISYDPSKNARNLAERGLPFDRVTELDWKSAVAREDLRKDYGERRLQILGLIDDRLHAAVVTIRGETLHVIVSAKPTSARSNAMPTKDDSASRPDDDNPEWTAADIRNAHPALEVVERIFGAEAALALRGPGRPTKPDRKVNQTLRLDADVVDAYRQSGRGWQARMNQVLREHMPNEHEVPKSETTIEVL